MALKFNHTNCAIPGEATQNDKICQKLLDMFLVAVSSSERWLPFVLEHQGLIAMKLRHYL